MIDAKRTGQRIKELCDTRGLSVKTLQEYLHIGAYQSIYNWFCGKTLPSLDNFCSLARLLGVMMDSLIVESSQPQVRIPEGVFVLWSNGNILQFEEKNARKRQKDCVRRMQRYFLLEKGCHYDV